MRALAAMDNDHQYDKYSTHELREALSTIDERKYPENHARPASELESRLAAEPKMGGTDFDIAGLRSLRPIVPWYQIIGSLLLLILLVLHLAGGAWSITLIALCVVAGSVNFLCGFLVLKNFRFGLIISAINFSLQAPRFVIGELTYGYRTFVEFSFGVVIRPKEVWLPFGLKFWPTIHLALGSNAVSEFHVNLITLGLFGLCLVLLFDKNESS